MTAEWMPKRIEAMEAEIDRLRNALRWIAFTAGIHVMGDAFDPEHMADLAEQASRALAGEPVPDFDEAVEQAKAKAKEMSARLAEMDTA